MRLHRAVRFILAGVLGGLLGGAVHAAPYEDEGVLRLRLRENQATAAALQRDIELDELARRQLDQVKRRLNQALLGVDDAQKLQARVAESVAVRWSAGGYLELGGWYIEDHRTIALLRHVIDAYRAATFRRLQWLPIALEGRLVVDMFRPNESGRARARNHVALLYASAWDEAERLLQESRARQQRKLMELKQVNQVIDALKITVEGPRLTTLAPTTSVTLSSPPPLVPPRFLGIASQ